MLEKESTDQDREMEQEPSNLLRCSSLERQHEGDFMGLATSNAVPYSVYPHHSHPHSHTHHYQQHHSHQQHQLQAQSQTQSQNLTQHLSVHHQQHQQQQQHLLPHSANDMTMNFFNSCETKSESGSSEMHSRPHTPTPTPTLTPTPTSNRSGTPGTPNLFASMNDLLGHHLDTLAAASSRNMGPPKKFHLQSSNDAMSSNVSVNAGGGNGGASVVTGSSSSSGSSGGVGGVNAGSSSGKAQLYDKHSPSGQYEGGGNGGSNGNPNSNAAVAAAAAAAAAANAATMSGGKRANRTRFTDYQIKVLQEFFENNSYPKDSDLEYLSKLLLLSPRVIVVWFQVNSLKIQIILCFVCRNLINSRSLID